MTFEQWWSTYQQHSKKEFTVTIAHAAYNAGYAANQAEKDARRKVAVDAIYGVDLTEAQLDAIIKECQG